MIKGFFIIIFLKFLVILDIIFAENYNYIFGIKRVMKNQ